MLLALTLKPDRAVLLVRVTANTTFNIAGSLGGTLANNINVDNATITEAGTNSFGTGALALTGTNTINNTGTLTVGSTNALSGSGSLTKMGSGTLVMASGGANNTYTGDVTLDAGTLQASNASNPFGSGVLNLNGGTLTAAQTTTLANSSFTVGGNATIGGSNNITMPTGVLSSGTLTVSDSGTTNFAGALSGTGGVTIASGTTQFSGNNGSLSGAIAVNGGVLDINNNNANPLGTGSLALNGGNLTSLVALSNPISNNFSVGGNSSITGTNSINFSGNGVLSSGDTLGITDTGTTTFSGSLQGSGNMTVNGGTVIFSGNNTGFSSADSYAGTTTITGAGSELSLTNSGALGYSNINATNNGTFNINNVNVADQGNVITLNNGNMTTDGTAGFNSPITLATSSTDTINVDTGSNFTLNNNINGQANLNISGPGSMVMNGEIGNVTPLLSTNVTIANITYGGTTTITLYNQNNNSPITLTNDADMISLLGNIYVNGTVNGNHPFTVQADNGTTYLYGVIGAGTPISTLQSFGQLIFDNGSVNTTGGQTYNGNVSLGSNTTLTSGNSAAIQFNGNVAGSGTDLTLNSGTGGIVVTGSLTTANLILNALGTNASFGSLTAGNTDIVGGGVITSDSQTYNGLLTLGGNTTLQTTGSGATQITLNNGLNANGNSVNVNGTGNNTFTFNSPQDVNVALSATHAGVATNGANTVNFTNVNTINADGINTNIISAPNLPKQNNFVITGSKIGYVNDPLFFNGFNIFQSTSGNDVATIDVPGANIDPTTGVVTFGSTTLQFINFASINGVTPTPPTPTPVVPTPATPATASSTPTFDSNLDISAIIQQPNAQNNNADDSSGWVYTTTPDQNIDQLVNQAATMFNTDLSNVKINPYCYQANAGY